MRSKVIFVGLLSISILTTCEPEEPDWLKALKMVDQANLYSNNYDGWKLAQEINYEKAAADYTIEKIDSDTLKVLYYLHNKRDNLVYVNAYRKQYKCSEDMTCFLKMQVRDTLYFYNELANGEKHFVVGEYPYRFEKFIMEPDEVNYFSVYEDSLRKVKGNNLPKLPTISDTEKKRLEHLSKNRIN